MDRFTRWPETIPLTDASAISCARALLAHWISRYGVPWNITSDRGRQFTSNLWIELANLMGFSRKMTTSYHPQSNRMVERFHRTFKQSLKARLGTSANWMDHLPLLLLALRPMWKEDSTSSVAELLHGTTLSFCLLYTSPSPRDRG